MRPQATYLNLVYDPSYPTGVLDLYAPQGSVQGKPLVVYVHGGGWEIGDKSVVSIHDPMLTTFNALIGAGYWVASVNYRLWSSSNGYVWPAMVQDTKSAVRWLKNNAGTYGYSSTRVAAWGSSAGGHITNCMAQSLSLTPATWEQGANQGGADSSVKAVVDWYGIFSLDTMPNPLPPGPFDPNVLVDVFGAPPYAAADPSTYVYRASAPALIQLGNMDTITYPNQGQPYATALTGVGVYNQLTIVQNAGHTFAPTPQGAVISPSLAGIATQVVAFLQGHV